MAHFPLGICVFDTQNEFHFIVKWIKGAFVLNLQVCPVLEESLLDQPRICRKPSPVNISQTSIFLGLGCMEVALLRNVCRPGGPQDF